MKLPTPVGLLQEEGVIGQILRQLPRRILDEAEAQNDPWSWLAMWVECNPVEQEYVGTVMGRDAECVGLERVGFRLTRAGVYTNRSPQQGGTIYQGVRAVRFQSDKYDSEKIFMHVTMDARWPEAFRKAFAAAASQRRAFDVLAQTARGGGSISSHDWHLEIIAADKAGNEKEAAVWANKHLASILTTELGRRWLIDDQAQGLTATPEMRRWARTSYKRLYAADCRRIGRKKADERWKSAKTPRFKMNGLGDKAAAAMTMEWLVAGPNGFPGLCFMSDELLAQLLCHALPWPSLSSDRIHGWKTIRTLRERLGLKKGPVLFNGMESVGANKWVILNERGAKTNSITLLPNKPLPPEL